MESKKTSGRSEVAILLDIFQGFRAVSSHRHRAPRACVGVEALESRALLSAGGGPRAASVRAAHAAPAEVVRVPLSQDPNPPWYPSLLAFEHHDSARTHLFAQARFGGSFSGPNR